MALQRTFRPRSPAYAAGLAALVIVLAGAVAWLGYRVIQRDGRTAEEAAFAPSGEWQTYASERFGFTLEYPPGWEVYEGHDPYVPVVNLYPPIVSLRPPFDQATDVVSVSVFPQGIRNALILSQSAGGDHRVESGVEGKLTAFTLASGETWAWRFVPDEPPAGWKPWGFVWARAKVSGLAFGCLRKGAEVPYEDCDPNGGDDVVRQGTLDAASAGTVEKILGSFAVPAAPAVKK